MLLLLCATAYYFAMVGCNSKSYWAWFSVIRLFVMVLFYLDFVSPFPCSFSSGRKFCSKIKELNKSCNNGRKNHKYILIATKNDVQTIAITSYKTKYFNQNIIGFHLMHWWFSIVGFWRKIGFVLMMFHNWKKKRIFLLVETTVQYTIVYGIAGNALFIISMFYTVRTYSNSRVHGNDTTFRFTFGVYSKSAAFDSIVAGLVGAFRFIYY